jgi:hypothetical protein
VKISAATLRRLEKLEASAPSNVGNWVTGLSGQLVWDPWDPEPTEEKAAATLASLMRQMDMLAERRRAQPDYVPPTEAQKAEATARFEEMVERMRAERQALRDFTAKIERERAARAAAYRPVPKTLPGNCNRGH